VYYAHFGLTQPPFTITPNTEFFFPGGNRGAVLEALIYAITHDQGIIKLTGEVGTGKTMLCRMLESRLPANVETAYLANPNVSPAEILRAIAHELHLAFSNNASRLEVTQTLHQHLLAQHSANKKVVVFVEESQNMPIETLEEIRLLSNLETAQHKLLQIVLFGQPELNENLLRPEIRQLKDRITHNFSLNPLKTNEVHDYLMHRMRTAGYRGPDLFPEKVVHYIAKAADGLTRRINIIADKTLLAAFADNTHSLKLKHAKLAVRDIELKVGIRRPLRLRAGAVWLLSGIALGVSIYWVYHWLATAPSPVVTEPAPSPQLPALAQPAIELATAAKVSQFADESSAEPVPALASSADPLQARLAATQNWLATQDARTYSIQLLGSGSEEQLKLYLKSLPINSEKLYVFRTVANQKPSLTVLYGTYPNRDLALGALEGLSDHLKAHRPYLRTVGGIRAEIRRISSR
jgi:type II secretory pathway predicted ATPase ExeA